MPGSIRLLSVVSVLSALAIAQGVPKVQEQSPMKAASRSEALVKKPGDGHLVRIQSITTPSEMVTFFYPPLRCDGDGNLYFPTELVGAPAIRKLNPKGERVAVFQANQDPDLKAGVATYYALDPDFGELHQLVFPEGLDRYVFIYKSDGTFKSAVKLQTDFPFFPGRIEVFPGGQFLVSGEEYDTDRTATMWPFTGIFAADGRLLKELGLEDDNTLHDMAASGDARVTRPGNRQANLAVDNGFLEMGADGNAYLMRWGNPAIFYAISAGGQVVRRFTVEGGQSDYRPVAMHINKNRIAVLFWEKLSGDEIMKIVDLEGHDVATYDAPHGAKGGDTGLGASFACYTQNPTRFTFLGADENGKVQILTAEPR